MMRSTTMARVRSHRLAVSTAVGGAFAKPAALTRPLLLAGGTIRPAARPPSSARLGGNGSAVWHTLRVGSRPRAGPFARPAALGIVEKLHGARDRYWMGGWPRGQRNRPLPWQTNRRMGEPPRVEWSSSVEAAGWVAAHLHPFARDVGSVVPEGFAAYARIFHPASRSGADPAKVRWAEIAARNGRTVHAEMQFHRISQRATGKGEPDPWDGYPPMGGSLAVDEAEALVQLLAEHTETPDHCWFCLWEGYGWVRGGPAVSQLSRGAVVQHPPGVVPPEVLAGPRVRFPHRDFLLYRGPITAATAFCPSWRQTPNLWWPDDRAWCIASEIDFCWTYVGGSTRLVAQVLADHRFEALPARLTEGITFDSDLLNR